MNGRRSTWCREQTSVGASIADLPKNVERTPKTGATAIAG